jgi:alpha-beta hydrolase superfamily lysophospholipase
MTHETGTFVGTDKTGIFYQSWVPEDAVATVIVVHGYAEHSGRYAHVAKALNASGYAVWALDHRGHGRSEGPRASVKRFEDFVADLATFVRLVQAKTVAGPLFMLGHSMGGLISTLYSFDHQDQLAGLILTGPAMKVDEGVSPLLLGLSVVLSAVAPQLPVGPFDPTGVSRDPDVVAAYINDKLNYTAGVKARMGRQFVLGTRSVLGRAPSLKLPILVIQGEADRLVSPAGTYAAFAAFGSADKTLKKYPGLYHEVLNEPEQDEILALICEWLNMRLKSVAATV